MGAGSRLRVLPRAVFSWGHVANGHDFGSYTHRVRTTIIGVVVAAGAVASLSAAGKKGLPVLAIVAVSFAVGE
jgi:hypothetical protein